MSLSVGIVGLPNVGKSTLFNALLKKQQALAANYPFATIEPNTGIVEVPDKRLHFLAETVAVPSSIESIQDPQQLLESTYIFQNQDKWPPIKPATIEFVDIAGLVAGASKGEGLGNQFLANIRETDLICHVLRAFEDSDVVLTGQMNPVDDLATVRTELIIKDIETLEKQEKTLRQLRQATITATRDKALSILSAGQMVSSHDWNQTQKEWLDTLHLLTAKPEIFVINIGENQLAVETMQHLKSTFADDLNVADVDIVIVSAKVEAELAQLSREEQTEYLKELGLNTSGLERMAETAYSKLDLMSFLTAGEKEVKAWTISSDTSAPQAAGTIHTDFEKKFIKAEVIDWSLFVSCGGWREARVQGKVRTEGKEYVMQDGDVVDFKIGT